MLNRRSFFGAVASLLAVGGTVQTKSVLAWAYLPNGKTLNMNTERERWLTSHFSIVKNHETMHTNYDQIRKL